MNRWAVRKAVGFPSTLRLEFARPEDLPLEIAATQATALLDKSTTWGGDAGRGTVKDKFKRQGARAKVAAVKATTAVRRELEMQDVCARGVAPQKSKGAQLKLTATKATATACP